MFGFRICLLVALVAATTSVTSAEDYVVPTGVTVLTEEQLLNQIIGSTLIGGKGKWVAYFLPPSGDQKKGRFRGKGGFEDDSPWRGLDGEWFTDVLAFRYNGHGLRQWLLYHQLRWRHSHLVPA